MWTEQGKEFLMSTFKNILVVCRSTRHCINVLRKGISLARAFDAKLYILHILYDPFNVDGWHLSAAAIEDEYKIIAAKTREELDRMVQTEKADGLVITEWIKNGYPADEIQKVVESEHVDLILMPAHKEGRLEHFLFGKTNDAIIRRLPATLMLVK
jgi:nucleotide-binding universal stress UspA family protein